MRSVTGLAGSNVSQRDMPTLGSLSMGHPNDSVPRDMPTISALSMGKPNDSGPHIDINKVSSQISTQQAQSSPTRMEDDGPRSPSILDNVHPSAPASRGRSPVGDSDLRPGLRGRSPTRRAVDNTRTRSQSTSTRGRTRGDSACRAVSRSQSRGPQPKVSPSIDQTAGATNFRKPVPKDQNKTEREKKCQWCRF